MGTGVRYDGLVLVPDVRPTGRPRALTGCLIGKRSDLKGSPFRPSSRRRSGPCDESQIGFQSMFGLPSSVISIVEEAADRIHQERDAVAAIVEGVEARRLNVLVVDQLEPVALHLVGDPLRLGRCIPEPCRNVDVVDRRRRSRPRSVPWPARSFRPAVAARRPLDRGSVVSYDPLVEHAVEPEWSRRSALPARWRGQPRRATMVAGATGRWRPVDAGVRISRMAIPSRPDGAPGCARLAPAASGLPVRIDRDGDRGHSAATATHRE